MYQYILNTYPCGSNFGLFCSMTISFEDMKIEVWYVLSEKNDVVWNFYSDMVPC